MRFHVPLHFDVEVCAQLVKSHRRKPEPYSKKWLDTALETLDILPMDVLIPPVEGAITGQPGSPERNAAIDHIA